MRDVCSAENVSVEAMEMIAAHTRRKPRLEPIHLENMLPGLMRADKGNWGGNQFHMENFTQAVCTFVNNPHPPNAPVNTMYGVGTGRYDGTSGFTVLFTLIDNGEPGRNDQACFRIYTTAPADVLNTSCQNELTPGDILNFPASNLITGNIQAHPDQH